MAVLNGHGSLKSEPCRSDSWPEAGRPQKRDGFQLVQNCHAWVKFT